MIVMSSNAGWRPRSTRKSTTSQCRVPRGSWLRKATPQSTTETKITQLQRICKIHAQLWVGKPRIGIALMEVVRACSIRR